MTVPEVELLCGEENFFFTDTEFKWRMANLWLELRALYITTNESTSNATRILLPMLPSFLRSVKA